VSTGTPPPLPKARTRAGERTDLQDASTPEELIGSSIAAIGDNLLYQNISTKAIKYIS